MTLFHSECLRWEQAVKQAIEDRFGLDPNAVLMMAITESERAITLKACYDQGLGPSDVVEFLEGFVDL